MLAKVEVSLRHREEIKQKSEDAEDAVLTSFDQGDRQQVRKKAT